MSYGGKNDLAVARYFTKIIGVKSCASVSYIIGATNSDTKATLGFTVGIDAVFTLHAATQGGPLKLDATAQAVVYYGVGKIRGYVGHVHYITPSISVTSTATRYTTTLTGSALSNLICQSYRDGIPAAGTSLEADELTIVSTYSNVFGDMTSNHGIVCWVKNLWLDTTQSISTKPR